MSDEDEAEPGWGGWLGKLANAITKLIMCGSTTDDSKD